MAHFLPPPPLGSYPAELSPGLPEPGSGSSGSGGARAAFEEPCVPSAAAPGVRAGRTASMGTLRCVCADQGAFRITDKYFLRWFMNSLSGRGSCWPGKGGGGSGVSRRSELAMARGSGRTVERVCAETTVRIYGLLQPRDSSPILAKTSLTVCLLKHSLCLRVFNSPLVHRGGRVQPR